MANPKDDSGPVSPRSRRRHRRVAARELVAELRYRGTVTSFTVPNVSMGGALIQGKPPPPLGAVLDIEFKFTGARSVALVGRAIYLVPEGIGLAFNPMTNAVAAAMEKLIAAVDARNTLPPPLPLGRPPREDELPPLAPRPGNEVFGESQDPRPPRSGSPDERAEYLRTLLKNRDDSLRRGRSMISPLIAEADALRALATRLKTRLEAGSGQQALNDAALAAARKAAERQTKAQVDERAAHEARLEDQQRQTLEAIAAVSGLEAKLRRQEGDVSRAKEEVAVARREAQEYAADSAGLRKAREELANANRKAMEAQAVLNKERNGRVAAELELAQMRGAHATAEAERKRLAEEVAKLKARLIAAETALDRPAPKRPAGVSRGPLK